jgi:hypothetical protein
MPTFLLIVTHPLRTVRQLKESPRWLGTFLLIAAGLVALRIASQGHLVEATVSALPATVTEADRDWTRAYLDSELLLRCVFLPLRQIAGMGLFTLMLYALCVAFDPPIRARFKQLFALEIHAELFNLLGACASLVTTLFVGNGDRGSPEMFALLTTPKIFTLWYVVVLAAGILTLFGYSRLKAGLLASTAWFVSVLFNAYLLQSVSASMHLHR